MADEAAVCFVSAQKYDISVTIDGQNHSTTTIKDKAHKARRNIKKCNKYIFADIPRGKYSPEYMNDQNIQASAKDTKVTVK